METIAYIYSIIVKALNDDITPEKAIEMIRAHLSI